MAPLKADPRITRAAKAAQISARSLAPSTHSDGDTKERPTALAAGISAPTALVSWAHRGEGWSDEEAAKWTQEVVEFTAGLRANGIDADLDLFHAHEAAIDWTRFGPAAVERADYVIVAISEAWAQRWSGANSANVGAGAVAEADALRGLFQVDQNHWQRKVMLVVLPSQDDAAIPKDLMRASRFWVDPEDADSFESLVRTLTGQPLYDKPALGRVPVLPPTVAASLGVSDKRSESAESAEFEDYSAVLDEVKRSSTKPKSAIANDRLALLMGLLDALSN